MPTLYVRDFPKELHDKVKALATGHRRSVSAEVTALVEQAVEAEAARKGRLEALDRIIERSEGYVLPPGAADSVTLLREDRER
jgi:plasmid stability protein